MSAAVRVGFVLDAESREVAVEIAPTGPAARAPVNVCAVVDVSGSMGELARVKDRTGAEVNDGLSILDVVKHALRTIAHSLGPNDRMSVVAYSTIARVVVELAAMDEGNKGRALDGIDCLRAGGQTNIADGLREGLDVLRAHRDLPGVTAMLLLTDGQPNVVPPSGHVTMLGRYADKNRFMVPIHTFGFGYNADSRLLVEIAEYTHGLYAFIPDATLVGTVFISTLAGLFTTLAATATLVIESAEPAEQETVEAPFAVRVVGNAAEMKIGALHQEQVRTVVVKCGRDPVRVAVRYSTGPGTFVVAESDYGASDRRASDYGASDYGASDRRASERARQEAALCIARCVDLGTRGKLGDARAAVSAILANADLPATLRVDLEGQVVEALESKESFERWGRHYLPSLGAAHLFQVSNNCKDPGVQEYGGPLFRSLREDTEDIFLGLPPPAVSYRMQPSTAYSSTAYSAVSVASASASTAYSASTAPVPNMAVYADYTSGSCFHGECLVEMHDGATKRVKEIRKGDVVKGGATVVCVVRTDTGKTVDMTRVGDLLVTAWHPMRGDEGHWVFPCEVEGAVVVRGASDVVYNFVLDRRHEVTVSGRVCVTLGHGLTGPVVAHPYFGTREVIEDLEMERGWETGLVRLVGAVRDAEGLVCGIISP